MFCWGLHFDYLELKGKEKSKSRLQTTDQAKEVCWQTSDIINWMCLKRIWLSLSPLVGLNEWTSMWKTHRSTQDCELIWEQRALCCALVGFGVRWCPGWWPGLTTATICSQFWFVFALFDSFWSQGVHAQGQAPTVYVILQSMLNTGTC